MSTKKRAKKRVTRQRLMPVATNASIEEQIALLEKQIALLQAQSQVQSSKSRATSATLCAKRKDDEEKHSELHSCAGGTGALHSALPTASPPVGNNTATFLRTWLDELQIMFENFSELVPELDNTELNTTDRRRLLGSGVRRYGFIEKVLEIGVDYPQFWPAFGGDEAELRERVDEIDALRNLLIWFRVATRVVGDLLLIAGDDAFRIAGSYYATSRDGARRKNPDAVQVFEMLRLFWRHRRRMNSEPTIPEVERDARALLRGRKDGKILIENESDQIIKGEKVIIDNVMPKPRGGMKVVERINKE